MAEPKIAYLSAGSNLGDRRAALVAAIEELGAKGVAARRVSSLFETEPVGFRDQPWFLNVAVKVSSNLTPWDLLRVCLDVEAAHGRKRIFAGAPRTLDLDILLFADEIVETPDLRIPHPRMTERRFVLLPLAEIAPEVIHPIHKLSIRRLLELCPDPSAVARYAGSLPYDPEFPKCLE